MALTVHLRKNSLYSVGNEENISQKYLTSYFILHTLYTKYYIYCARCYQQALFLEMFKRKLLFMHKTHMEIAINNNDLTKFEKEWSQFWPLVNSIGV